MSRQNYREAAHRAGVGCRDGHKPATKNGLDHSRPARVLAPTPLTITRWPPRPIRRSKCLVGAVLLL